MLLTIENLFAQPKVKSIDMEYANEKENLNVFQQWLRWSDPGSLFINHLVSQADYYYDIRDKKIANLKTRQDWEERQKLVKRKLMDIVGPFPEKTPLNVQITGILQRDGYRVEKVVYESMPGLYVTGCLFIPENLKGKAPAILNVIGHDNKAFRADLYQTVILNLVRKGMIVFAIDPPGQGERVQYFDPQINLSSVGYSVPEHCYVGNQCFLTGVSVARYFIWDGIRAIDYLVTRKEVDPLRIGVTGLSGGGTITSYVSAFDDRVSVSVPCSWATACKRTFETKGAQDAETEFWRGVAEGITFEDLLEVRAPKPTLLTFTSRDQYLSLQGAREAYREAQKTYEAFGKKENIQLIEDYYKHWLTPKLRVALYSFFMQHFKIQGDPSEEDVELIKEAELKVTPTGQVSTSLQSKAVFDINKEGTVKLIENLEKSRNDIEGHLERVKTNAMRISGYIAPIPNEVDNTFINGSYQREGYIIEKLAIQGEGNYVIPILLFVPDSSTEKYPAIIYIHPKGKAAEANPGGEIEKLVKKGYIVAAADVSGTGELKDNASMGKYATAYTAVLIGRSVVGVQTGDIVRVVNYLKRLPCIDKKRIGAMAVDEMCIPLIHAAAFEPSIDHVVLKGSLVSYRSVAMSRDYKIGLSKHEGGGLWHPYDIDFSWGVAGVLTGYDLPDLIACIAPRKVILAGLKDQMLEPAPESLIKQEMEFPLRVYSYRNVPGNIIIGGEELLHEIL